MSVILLILGLMLTAAGVVSIGYGIPINEFNLGNTLIVSGTTAVAAGLILIGLYAAVDQLTQIAKALRPRAGARPQAAELPPAAERALPAAARPGQFPLPVQAQAPAQAPAAQAKAPMPAPPRGPMFARTQPEDHVAEAAPAESSPEVPFSAIERLRSSLGTDRRAGDAADAEDVPYAPGAPAPAGPGREANFGANGAARAGGAGAVEAANKPPLDFLFRSKTRPPQPEAFDAVWPKRGPRRDEPADIGEAAKPTTAEAPIERPPLSETSSPSATDEMRPPAILKSGVVDGMAYTLYADGSIEAQLPQGTVRFGSIAELRTHIENNS